MLDYFRMVKDMVAKNRPTEVRRLLKVLGQDFANSQINPHSRKGGLIGLAAMAVALGKVNQQKPFFTGELMLTVLDRLAL